MSYKKIVFLVSILTVFGFLFNFNVQNANALTTGELQTMISQLQQQLAQLQQQLLQLQSQSTTTVAWCHTFNTSLKIGDTGTEVGFLKTALQKEGFSVGDTNEFDETTASAVVAFQEKYASEILTPVRLTHGNGFVGKLTRTKLNKIYGCTITPICIQVITYAKNPLTGECKQYSTPCDVPAGWTVVNSCSTCTNECILGSRKCSGNGYQTCGNYDNDTCSEWGSITNCPTGSTCSNGICAISGFGCSQKCKSLGYSLGMCKTFSVTPSGYTDEQTFLKYYDKIGETTDCSLPSGMVGVNYSCYCYPKKDKSLTVVSPNGGEQWMRGYTYPITWKSTGIEKVNIYFAPEVMPAISCVPCAEGTYCAPCGYTKIASDISASLGRYSWALPTSLVVGQKYKVRVDAAYYTGYTTYLYDDGDGFFNVIEGQYTCTDSDGGKNIYMKGTTSAYFEVGKFETRQDYCARQDIEISPNNFTSVSSCTGTTCYVNEYWVDAVCSGYGQILACPNGCSNGACLIGAPPIIKVISPNGGEKLTYGSTSNIVWSFAHTGKVNIYLEKWAGSDGIIFAGGPFTYTIATGVSASLGTYSWSVGKVTGVNTVVAGDRYKIRITEATLGQVAIDEPWSDSSDNYFSIITSTDSSCAKEGEYFSSVFKDQYPEHCCTGLTEWNSGMDTSISVADKCYATELLAGYPVGTCINCGNKVCESIENPCNCPADCVGIGKSTYKTVNEFCQNGYSKYCLSLMDSELCSLCPSKKSITVLSPNGGEQWKRGYTYPITWKSTGISKVNIYFIQDYKGYGVLPEIACDPCVEGTYCAPCEYTKIASDISASLGRYSWTLPTSLVVGQKYKIRIDAAYYTGYTTYLYDDGDGFFSVIADQYTCTDSDGGKEYYKFGTVIDNTGKTYVDACVNSGIGFNPLIQDKNTLIEHYCTTIGSDKFVYYTCPYGCENGACKSFDSNCVYLYWHDNTTRVCGYKQFCGTYMYYGLKTFSSKTACQASLDAICSQECIDKGYPLGGSYCVANEQGVLDTCCCTGEKTSSNDLSYLYAALAQLLEQLATLKK